MRSLRRLAAGLLLLLTAACAPAGRLHPPPMPAGAWQPGIALLPDPRLTPGAVLPGLTAAQVCRPGWAAAVRHVEPGLRRAVYAAYGLPRGNHTGFCAGPGGCELDHLVSLELGGSNDAANLWPQPHASAIVKDRLEDELHRMVCTGRLNLAQAQDMIARDWVAAYRRVFGE